jgi:hypothetical protein
MLSVPKVLSKYSLRSSSLLAGYTCSQYLGSARRMEAIASPDVMNLQTLSFGHPVVLVFQWYSGLTSSILEVFSAEYQT